MFFTKRMVRKHFSIIEAESLLPRISPLLRRAQRLKAELERYEQVSMRQRVRTDGSEELIEFSEILDSEHQTLKESFYETVDKLCELGCIIRDLDQGIINFYTLFEGKDVFLSWQQGERRINHWHEPDETTRKKIIDFS